MTLTARTVECGADWTPTRSGLLLAPEHAPPRLPIAVDLFAGAGGFSCGFHQAGWHVAVAVESDISSAMTYLANLGGPDTVVHIGQSPPPGLPNKDRAWWSSVAGTAQPARDSGFPAGHGWIAHHDCDCPPEHHRGNNARPPHDAPCEHLWIADIREVTGASILNALGLDVGDVDAVIGGPPCQGFSIAGRRNVCDPRNSLVFEFARLVLELRPATMVMENVPGIVDMTTPEGAPVLDALARVLADGGFSTYDALRKSLAVTPNARAAMRREATPSSTPGPDPTEQSPERGQLDLFSGTAGTTTDPMTARKATA